MQSISAITLASSTACRIGQLVRLLSSDRSGEVVAAATAINRTLAGAGLDIHHLADVTEHALQHAPSLAPRCPAVDDDELADIVLFCARRAHMLNEREEDFIRNLDRKALQDGDEFDPTDKQRVWLLGIYQKLRGRQ